MIITLSAEETFQVGVELAQKLTPQDVVAFFGDLGAGKTTLVRGIASYFGVEPHSVCSPTFTYLNIYQGQPCIYHFDLYRIEKESQFLAAGFEEYLKAGICCIEWAEKIASLLPVDTYKVLIEMGETLSHRKIHIEK